ncbi:acetolactate synthase large subunit [Sulfitobacter sp. S190]|uniref:acetolactate synthase large subunit n=1 Tax=Sulfitobacter sp. S190 TaxID=2867022 RepID=UPI0021A6AEEC|nr:acetolactate synthase large subunit [Sulfitobacter sp. S190]UWR24457.1 acetolactate synthase large subunit [Sulfitobacter sp. S190]
MKASDLFVKCLEAEGVERIYGVPGEENADFMMSLQDSSIEFVLTRHEQGAAFMAEVYGRLTGKVGVCLGTLGPGATNLITGVADGNMDRAPMLVLTGQGALTRQHKESHQVMNVVEMYKPVTKWSTAINAASNIPEIVHKAVKLATAEKPGACHIELAEDVAATQTDERPMRAARVRRPVPGDDVIDQVWDRLRSAKTPLIIAGNGAIRTRASAQLRQFCEATGIGALMTFMGKGALDLEDPRCLFTVGMGQRDYPQLAIDAADLILTVGFDPVEYGPEKWNSGCGADIIHMDFAPAESDKYYQPSIEVVGDVAHGLSMLNARAERDGAPRYDLASQTKLRERMQSEFAEHAQDRTTGSIRPQKAVADVRAVLGPDDIVLSGVGAHKMWIARHYQCHAPGTCLISNGFCSMGMPLPGAIAAKHACPDAKVLAVVGDADVMMNVQEMETASRLGSDITVLVWEDKAYGLIAWKQEQEFGEHTDLSFTNPDWMQLCDALDWQGQRCDNAEELQSALQRALDHRGPSMVVIPIDYRENMKLTERLGKITETF